MDVQRNKVAYLTGSSRGIGKGLKEALLAAGYEVYGLSRSEQAANLGFTPVQIDLGDLDAVQSFTFDAQASGVVLINNAGAIGDIAPVGALLGKSIHQVMNINSIAPQMLMNRFMETYLETAQNGHILNISSGAGKYPIDAWATYCASKAALDLFSKTIRAELELRGRKNWHIHSVAPGVVDTKMQDEIRAAEPEKFLGLQKFLDLKTNNELTPPDHVAAKIMQVISAPESFEKTIISVRDF